MKKRILFFDDEPNILQGLKRLLRSQRHEWDMQFSEGGEQALEMLEQEPFDAIISDMKMPEIRFDLTQTIESVKRSIEKRFGTIAEKMELILQDCNVNQ